MTQNTGRPRIPIPEEFPKFHKDWKAGKLFAVTVMSELGLSKSTFYRMVSAYEANLEQEKYQEELIKEKLEHEHQEQETKEKQAIATQKIKQFVKKINKTKQVN